MSISKIRTLLLYSGFNNLAYYDDWRESFLNDQRLEVTVIDVYNDPQNTDLLRTINDFELIILLHSVNGNTLEYINPYIDILNNRNGKLLTFIGNELNYPQISKGLRSKIKFLKQIEPEFIGTQLPISTANKLYEDLRNSKVVALPHGLNPKRYYPTIPLRERKIDIGVRSSFYSIILGDNDRKNIIDYFSSLDTNLAMDIETSLNKRFATNEWAEYLNLCRGTVSTESGSLYVEKDDATAIQIDDFIRNKKSVFNKFIEYRFGKNVIKKVIPEFIFEFAKKIFQVESRREDYKRSSFNEFDEIYDKFLSNYKNPLSGKCISSRHFDAIGTKTCQIMFQGDFNGILEENKHYISLKKDFSNINEVLEKFNDNDYVENMVDNAYEYVLRNHTYSHRINDIYSLI